MDELIDIVDEQGNYTGKTCLKSEAHKFGYFHPTVHIWIYTKDHKILLQQRAFTKKVFPGLWDISVAGHIGAGEIIEEAAIREVEEEIGFKVKPENLIKIGTRKHQVNHPNGIIDNEFHHVFITELNVPVEELIIQESEVAGLQLYDLDILNKTSEYENVLLPEYSQYYESVFTAIIAKTEKS
ncbi:NUDIX domain-containing protein [uncultured Tenacibaculum sp.]|uniref:NUDIX hydrolase n=1 Tax=uncultured Tenacibaculum sp. TaxID=174713 RepID=UPI0026029DCB|nr:NUDIX domain-containing protein [uncultured Tenacibaculum sp.]